MGSRHGRPAPVRRAARVLAAGMFALAATPAFALTPPSITQNASLAVQPTTFKWACAGGVLPIMTAANQWTRRFRLAQDHGITTPVQVIGVDFGVEAAGGARGEIPVSVLLRTIPRAAPLTWANTTVIYTASRLASVATPAVLSVQTFATVANPAAEDLVVEIAAWDGTTLPWRESYFYIGANTAGQSRPAYWSATQCDQDEPLELTTGGGASLHVVMVVHLRDVPTPAEGSSWGRIKAMYREGSRR